jgi:hypothetical protein
VEQHQFEEARAFIEAVPWRAVKQRAYKESEPGVTKEAPPDPHEYVVVQWEEVDNEAFWKFVRLIREFGYKGEYSPPYAPERKMVNDYLEIDGYVYWSTNTLINRQKAEHRQHEIIAPAVVVAPVAGRRGRCGSVKTAQIHHPVGAGQRASGVRPRSDSECVRRNQRVTLSNHCVNRFHERVRPALEVLHARAQLEYLIEHGKIEKAPPDWMARTMRQKADAYLVVGTDLVLPLVAAGPLGEMVAKTCISRGGISEQARQRRSARAHDRKNARRARRRR